MSDSLKMSGEGQEDVTKVNEGETNERPKHFIEQIIDEDLASGKHKTIATRFPPEPNGYLHIGHAKAICLNFGLSIEYSGTCNLRMDDTNPEKEEQEYVHAIKEDVAWLGYSWNKEVRHASNYFQQLYDFAIQLIKSGKAYVCELNADQTRAYRGTLTEPGKDSPYRERTLEENLALFEKMRAGEVKEGQMALRAKIDMSSGNMNMRDPVLYRVKYADHPITGDQWCIYPTYDYAHCVSDAIEGITHSLCTLEFEDHRPLYDWILEQLNFDPRPRQIEFSRLNLNYTLTSKRKLKKLVDEGYVDGWDDPRMPTISGLRRRGYTPGALRKFCEMVGITKSDGVVDVGMLEFAIRDDLDHSAPRALCVLRPLKVTITNYGDQVEQLEGQRHPKMPELGHRVLPFSKEIWIDRDDFMEDPPKKYFRLAPGKEVRLRHAYVIKCEEVVRDETGAVIELKCTYDANTLGKKPEGRKVKGVIHWVSASDALPVEVRQYDRLFDQPNPESEGDEAGDFTQNLNKHSLTIFQEALAEPSLANAKADDRFQFEREGYYCLDVPRLKNNVQVTVEGSGAQKSKLVFNQIVSLKDSWQK